MDDFIHDNRETKMKIDKFVDAADGFLKGGKGSGQKGHKSSKGMTSHPMHTKDDYAYLKKKGYSDKEIKAIWDRDMKAGKDPTHHDSVPDVTGILSGKNLSSAIQRHIALKEK